MSLTLDQFGLERLDTAQKLELIRLLWDSIPHDVPYSPPGWHVQELERRIADADAHPDVAESWEKIYARLSRKS